MSERVDQWAQSAIDTLATGQRARLQVFGNSMRPRILSRSFVTLAPRLAYAVGDVVLVDIEGRTRLHAIRELGTQAHDAGPMVLIGDERGRIDGWVPVTAIHGVVVEIEPTGAPK